MREGEEEGTIGSLSWVGDGGEGGVIGLVRGESLVELGEDLSGGAGDDCVRWWCWGCVWDCPEG